MSSFQTNIQMSLIENVTLFHSTHDLHLSEALDRLKKCTLLVKNCNPLSNFKRKKKICRLYQLRKQSFNVSGNISFKIPDFFIKVDLIDQKLQLRFANLISKKVLFIFAKHATRGF